MRLLCIGDVCGDAGCEKVKKTLPKIKRDYNVDAVIVNGENSASNNGVTPFSADFLFACGADVITGGNHSFRNSQIVPYLESNEFILRPHNLPEAQGGRGYCLIDKGRYSIAVINLAGTIYLERLKAENPFLAADELVKKAKQDGADIIVVDFHAEATSEKRALGFYLDGKVSAVFGTHTHIQTADNKILPEGTGYIPDLGMTGPENSVLGVKTEIIIGRLKSGDMSKFEFAEGDSTLNGCIFEIDEKNGKTLSTERIII